MRSDVDSTSLKVTSEVTLASRIRRERQRRSWSQERLAKEMSVALGAPFAQSSVSKLERGPEGRIISAAELVAFGIVFEVDPLSLMLPDGAFDLHQTLAALADLEKAMRNLHHAQKITEDARDQLLDAAAAFVEPLKEMDDAVRQQVYEGLERLGRREDMRQVWARVVLQLYASSADVEKYLGVEAMREAQQVIGDQAPFKLPDVEAYLAAAGQGSQAPPA